MNQPPESFTPQPVRLGACYYPEHWPEQMRAGNAQRMTEATLQPAGVAVLRLTRN
jgi:hypothetical protein